MAVLVAVTVLASVTRALAVLQATWMAIRCTTGMIMSRTAAAVTIAAAAAIVAAAGVTVAMAPYRNKR